MRTALALALVAALVLGGWIATRPAARPAPPTAAPADPCVRWQGEPALLSPVDRRSRHHPSVALGPDQQVIVAWQLDKSPSAIGLARYAAPWTPTDAEQIVSIADTQPSHPQLAVDGEQQALTWVDDHTGALRLLHLPPAGGPPPPADDLVPPGAERPAAYPDLLPLGAGRYVALWYDGADPQPRWTLAQLTPDAAPRTQLLPAHPDAELGGPPALALAPDGTVWLAWTEQDLTRLGRTSRLMTAHLDATGAISTPTEVARAKARWDRPAIALDADGRVVLGWTGYPYVGGAWSAWLLIVGVHSEPVRLDPQLGHMVDLAVTDHRAVLAWEEEQPAGRDLRLQVFDTRTGAPRCAPTTPHPPDEHEQARATLALQPGPEGQVAGVLVWHASTEVPRRQAIWGRRFSLPSP